MKATILILTALFLALPIIAGCTKNERVVERRETIEFQTPAEPIVVGD